MRKRTLGFVALGATASILLSACGGGGSAGGDSGSDAAFNQGATEVVNPSDKAGGTLRYAIATDFDSTDPGDTYYGFSWNFSRYYARTLLTFTPAPGEESTTLATDLAAGMPEPNDDFTEWTVKIQEGLKYEDGSEITAQDIEYAIARSNYNGGELPNGPRYFQQHLDQETFNVYEVDDPLETLTAVETPDDHTLVFHLNSPFSEFPYVLTQPQTAPVPMEADRGALYKEHVVSSGPYKFDGDYEPGVKLNLVRNEHWDPETDPIRPALPDEVTVQIGIDQEEIDRRLVNGDIDVDLAGTGVGPAMASTLLTDESAQANLDNPFSGALRYVNIHTPIIEDVACRQAIMYAADRESLHRAWGGDSGGEIATNLLPPTIPGANPESDLYPSEDNKGDLDSAKAKLEECGKADGFSTTIAVREGRPEDIATAESLQQSLKRVGIELDIQTFPAADFFAQYAGSRDYVRENDIGLSVSGWSPDWATGYGFASKITDGDAIQDTGNFNTSELDDPEVNGLWDKALETEDPTERADIYEQIDTLVMEQAAILPVVFDRALYYRSNELTNVYHMSAYAMYDFMALGVDRG
ncbi:peptide/nickel transport system substrate-binding protein [Nocardiopsis arvandica]|uniref:Peptide/nickel transport system substrate-binding protein n=1 Tax=Nocardiopsis sinuspersici TaxID=501010 RepID=A0A7Z0BMN3_9ACTN|nr:ABC transporter substrate-binding protein [Nocardiopsis sinuspersici]NYH54752.1 peptide/nickel transport system substrate-binding protein [Nocardiopsis sinuspersici]